jgi:hypothetical protein
MHGQKHNGLLKGFVRRLAFPSGPNHDGGDEIMENRVVIASGAHHRLTQGRGYRPVS